MSLPAATAPPTPGPSEEWVVNRVRTGRLQGVDLKEAWRYRELAQLLALRTLKLRYRQTFIGVAWVVLQPLVTLAIFAVVFGHYAHLPAQGIPYATFVFPGLVIWTYVSTAVNGAAVELVSNQELVTKVYFPRVLAPVSALLSGLPDLGISLVLTGILMAVTGVAPGWAVVLLPVWLAAALGVSLGTGLLLAALNVRFRDVRQTLPFLIQTWFFITPVVYAGSLVGDGGLRSLLALNPMVGVIDGLRWSLLDARVPPVTDALGLVTLAALLAGGILYFRASERWFADVI